MLKPFTFANIDKGIMCNDETVIYKLMRNIYKYM